MWASPVRRPTDSNDGGEECGDVRGADIEGSGGVAGCVSEEPERIADSVSKEPGGIANYLSEGLRGIADFVSQEQGAPPTASSWTLAADRSARDLRGQIIVCRARKRAAS